MLILYAFLNLFEISMKESKYLYFSEEKIINKILRVFLH